MGFDHTILVQAAPTLAETAFMLELAERTPSVAGVVGWLDLLDPDHLLHYERFSRHPKYAGFRLMIPSGEEALSPAFIDALRQYEKLDVPVDLLLVSDQLDTLAALMEQVPNLRGVINHLAKPRIAEGIVEPWRAQMSRLARYPRLYCKLSGLVTEADHASWKPEHFTAYIGHVLHEFGPDRVMFGSDWPVALQAATYKEVVELLHNALPPGWDTAKLFGLNAKEFYKR
ncbi:amidohydrolase family protein [Paenibacillus protaetiae]|uniref:amidohydrolase family protein n=1 Tax=Paenibacillus protaetiae TaxID=2509456 RepID=UPI0026A4AB7B